MGKEPLTPDGKLGCRSCPSKWRFPARYIAHPKLIDGTAGDDWPLCETHMPFAMVAIAKDLARCGGVNG